MSKKEHFVIYQLKDSLDSLQYIFDDMILVKHMIWSNVVNI